MNDPMIGRTLIFPNNSSWVVYEKLSDGIYAIHNIYPFSAARGSWPGYFYNKKQNYSENFHFRDICPYTGSGNAQNCYNAISYAEANGGRDDITGEYDPKATQDGIYLLPYKYYTGELNGIKGHLIAQVLKKTFMHNMTYHQWTGSCGTNGFAYIVEYISNEAAVKANTDAQSNASAYIYGSFNLDANKVNIDAEGIITPK